MLYLTDQEINFIRNSLRALFQALRIIINRLEYYVIHVQFCMEFQNSFFQAHHLFPDTFYYQLLFDVLLENTVISDMLGMHAGMHAGIIVIAIYLCEYVYFIFYRYLKNQSVDF